MATRQSGLTFRVMITGRYKVVDERTGEVVAGFNVLEVARDFINSHYFGKYLSIDTCVNEYGCLI